MNVEERPVPAGASYRAAHICHEWLKWCLGEGWTESQLDVLEALWWAHHDRLTGKPT